MYIRWLTTIIAEFTKLPSIWSMVMKSLVPHNCEKGKVIFLLPF